MTSDSHSRHTLRISVVHATGNRTQMSSALWLPQEGEMKRIWKMAKCAASHLTPAANPAPIKQKPGRTETPDSHLPHLMVTFGLTMNSRIPRIPKGRKKQMAEGKQTTLIAIDHGFSHIKTVDEIFETAISRIYLQQAGTHNGACLRDGTLSWDC